jgi:hypothetical protein
MVNKAFLFCAAVLVSVAFMLNCSDDSSISSVQDEYCYVQANCHLVDSEDTVGVTRGGAYVTRDNGGTRGSRSVRATFINFYLVTVDPNNPTVKDTSVKKIAITVDSAIYRDTLAVYKDYAVFAIAVNDDDSVVNKSPYIPLDLELGSNLLVINLGAVITEYEIPITVPNGVDSLALFRNTLLVIQNL